MLTLCVGCGCNRTSGVSGGPSPSSGTGKKYPLVSDVAPKGKYSPHAKLTLGRDMTVVVDVDQKEQANDLLVDLTAHGQSFEKEIYRSDGNAFYLVNAVGVEYQPPIKLLQFPLQVGDSWPWTGKLLNAGHSNNGTATITTSADRLLLPGAPADTILVEVKLEIDNGTPTWAQRKLAFWFLPGKGIVRRNFGTSARDPVE